MIICEMLDIKNELHFTNGAYENMAVTVLLNVWATCLGMQQYRNTRNKLLPFQFNTQEMLQVLHSLLVYQVQLNWLLMTFWFLTMSLQILVMDMTAVLDLSLVSLLSNQAVTVPHSLSKRAITLDTISNKALRRRALLV